MRVAGNNCAAVETRRGNSPTTGASWRYQDMKTYLSTAEIRFIASYNPKAKPFKWRKREVKGSQLRNTIVNLCN